MVDFVWKAELEPKLTFAQGKLSPVSDQEKINRRIACKNQVFWLLKVWSLFFRLRIWRILLSSQLGSEPGHWHRQWTMVKKPSPTITKRKSDCTFFKCLESMWIMLTSSSFGIFFENSKFNNHRVYIPLEPAAYAMNCFHFDISSLEILSWYISSIHPK